ncbi:MAG: type 4a pilus biogenesis protein PilO [Gemmatimonadota bacterium]|nr:type 4a pilus biogenesis protein PilO [Gemmatimonadota bacterium]MDH4349824.1 type 4a pilus biogenesis protein PilO [Gemmatimonadota bacterium]MDH5198506.1 type 4a pilus biogenesis protein PilO [Gemmatimonadota bacterium]
MAMSDKEKKQLMWLLMVVPIGAIALFWFLVREPKAQETADLHRQVDSLQLTVDSARRELARGSVEDLRQRVGDIEAGLGLMRTLVPTDNEVAQLINDISDRAKLRNVSVADLSPLGSEDGGQYRVARYRFQVLGHYDEIGAFLSDIASLRRIMVAHQVSLTIASDQAAQAVGDTTGSLLQASFQLKAYVKQPPLQGEGGAGGDR